MRHSHPVVDTESCERRMHSHRICLQGTRHHGVDDLVLGRHLGFFGGRGGSGFQPAMTRPQYRALALSVMPGRIRRSSTAAENSPP